MSPREDVLPLRQAPFTLAGVTRGFRAGQPLAFGVFVYGVAFGLLALAAAQGGSRALAMSAAINSGSAQTVVVNALATGMGLTATVIAVALLNARYLIYGASLHPWLGPVGGWRAYASLFLLGDGNWLLSLAARERGEQDAGYVLGSGLATYLAWLMGTLAGVLAGAWIPSPEALGLDFLLIALCAAMGMAALRNPSGRGSSVTALAALVAALGFDLLAGAGPAIVAAGVAGVATAWWSNRESARRR